MKQFVISGKAAAPLSNCAASYLTLAQRDIKRRFKTYQRGGMQGLPMIWDNMMEALKKKHEIKG